MGVDREVGAPLISFRSLPTWLRLPYISVRTRNWLDSKLKVKTVNKVGTTVHRVEPRVTDHVVIHAGESLNENEINK